MKMYSPLAAAALVGLLSSGAQAAAPTIANQLSSGTQQGSVAAESYFHVGGAENWSFWTFDAAFLTEVSITVTPGDAAFDPIIAVWYGIESDTANYFDLTSSSLNTLFVAGSDGSESNPFAGAGEAASLSFFNNYGNGPFLLAIADWQDGSGSGALAYTITASVPEPSTWAQLALGLGLLGAFASRKRA